MGEGLHIWVRAIPPKVAVMKKREAGLRRPPEYDSPKDSVMNAYFFLDDFLLLPALDFFAEAFALFLAAISNHRLSCRTGPPGRASGHNLPNRFG
jgi:hypothetical protein